MLASASFSLFAPNLLLIQATTGSRSRSNIHSARPSAHMFLQRSASLLREPVRLHRLKRQPRDIERHHLNGASARVLQRIGRLARLAQVAFVEGAGIGDDQAAGAQIGAGSP